MSARVRVVSDAVVGGGLHLASGDIVQFEDLGEYARPLMRLGALKPLPEKSPLRDVPEECGTAVSER